MTRESAPTPAGTAATDPEVREEIIDNVRRFVAREVVPHAAGFERADEFPSDIVAGMRELGLFGVTIPEEYGGLGLDLLTYIGVIEELAYGWMSLTGIVNTHTMVATLLMAHGGEEQQQRWLPDMASGRAARRPVAVRAGRRQRHPQHLLPRHPRRRRVRAQRHQGVGDQRRARLARRARRPHRSRASAPSSSRRSRDARFGGISVSRHVGKLGYKRRRDRGDGLRRPPHPGGQPRRRARPRAAADPRRRWRSAGSTSRRARPASPGPPSTPRCSTPSSARPSASPSPSTRRSSSSSPTWRPGWRRPGC